MKWLLNQIVESSRGRWLFRGVQGSLLFIGGLLLYFTAELTPKFKAKHEELRSRFSLEQRVMGLRLTVTDSAIQVAEKKAAEGTFANWQELAMWLESLRANALERKVQLEYFLGTTPETFSEVGGIARFPLTLTVSDRQQDYSGMLRFIRDGVYHRDLLLSTNSFFVSADSLGVEFIELQIDGWILQ